MFDILDEAPQHCGAREALLDLCFGLDRREKTSERLREGRVPAFAFSAVTGEGELAGTVRLWLVRDHAERVALLLGPLAVAPQLRGRKAGDRLVRHALTRAAIGGFGSVLLVGDLAYYRRFGFAPGLLDRAALPGPVDRHRFLAADLIPGHAATLTGCLKAAGDLCPSGTGTGLSEHLLLPRRGRSRSG
ncbi:N-acetyltransferase [Roseibium aquae]|uniref:N-acetyltransferase n=1 Tax=Roseibium aquae TaxID=1323746 RepID=A0A916TKX9_9HYPH|nr:N-acetyltransferase [Roseibium aquae]GGB50197.1 N-acetyltransferase [Roseibium aquae]